MNWTKTLDGGRARMISLCLVACALAASPALAGGELTPHTAEYKIKISVVGGRLSTELKSTDSGYIARHYVEPTGLSKIVAHGDITEVSEFGAGDDGIYPISYQTNDTIAKDDPRADIQFDWNTLEASGTVNDEEFHRDLDRLRQDRVSIQYALMHDLLNDQLRTQYELFEADKLKTLNVRSIGTREIKVPAGTFTAVGIQHQAENSSRVTTLWCAKEIDYLPVVIEQHRKGKLRVQAKLRRYTPGD
ncbi:MAG: DUF3108 domain-containing protein [Gammaproteobacteria bacterium]|nr:DUF3108 domain-containing protein [Gammaproteobacteria bacterium]MBU2676604.1 DUF3108 domain-containing protein [Gammaproteobacteria bacterium]NNL50339.1 DUF3108 domain-containing protein [Woeseiaceae bacterium]